jgi:hypothetical protein
MFHTQNGVALLVLQDSAGPPDLNPFKFTSLIKGQLIWVHDLPSLFVLPVTELFAKWQPFLDHFLREHQLLRSNPGWYALLVFEDLLDFSHRNLAPTKHLVEQLTSSFEQKRLTLVIMLAVTFFFLPDFYLAGSSGVVSDKVFRTTICFLTTLVADQRCSGTNCFHTFLQPSHYFLPFLQVKWKLANMVQVWALLDDAILNGNSWFLLLLSAGDIIPR